MRFIATIASLATVAFAVASGPEYEPISGPSYGDVSKKIDEGRSDADNYKCPDSMDYSPWTRSCECRPGQSYDTNERSCGGDPHSGPWDLPKCDFSGAKVALAAFCAISPTKFTKYDAHHEWCQIALDTFVFCAEADIEAELLALRLGINLDVELDVSLHSTISDRLRGVSGGLAAIFLELAADAFLLFDLDVLGLIAVNIDISLLGLLGGGNRGKFDCVSYSTKGCHNFIAGEIGLHLEALIGLAIIEDLIFFLDAEIVASLAIADLICINLGLNAPLIEDYRHSCRA